MLQILIKKNLVFLGGTEKVFHWTWRNEGWHQKATRKTWRGKVDPNSSIFISFQLETPNETMAEKVKELADDNLVGGVFPSLFLFDTPILIQIGFVQWLRQVEPFLWNGRCRILVCHLYLKICRLGAGCVILRHLFLPCFKLNRLKWRWRN